MKRIVFLLLTLMMLCALAPVHADVSDVSESDYFGYWEAVKVEMDGVDITAEALAHGRQAVTFHANGALLYGASVSINMDTGEITSTPTETPCAWVFLPDGSMFVLQTRHPLTFRKSGDYLLVDDDGILLYFAQTPRGPMAANPATEADYIGCWEAVKVEVDGADCTADYSRRKQIAALILRPDGQGESFSIVPLVQEPDWSSTFTGEESDISWQLDESGIVHVTSVWSYITYRFNENGEPYDERLITENVSFTLHPEGELLTLERTFGSDSTLRFIFRKEVSSVTPEDFLGEWEAVKILQDGSDVTSQELRPTREISLTISPDKVITTDTGKTRATDTHSWKYLLNGTALAGGYVCLHFEDDLLVSEEWDTTTYYIRKGASATKSDPATVTAEYYKGYWKIVKVEQNGVDITEQALYYGEAGVTFAGDHALWHSYDITFGPEGPVATPVITTCAWVFQPDASMDVLFDGRMFTFRLSGDTLLMDLGTEHYTYVRAQEPGTPAPQRSITPEDYFGYWKAVKFEMDGVDLTEEVLSYGEQGVTFASGQATLHGTEITSMNGQTTAKPSLTSAAWIFQPDGSMQLLVGGSTLTYRLQGEQLVTEYAGATIRYAREDAPEAPADPAAPDAEDAAFLRIFTHPATQTDMELVLVSAHASEKVYDPEDVTAYLVSLGFPEESIRTHDYTPEDPHSVAVTFASRTVMSPQGQPVTLYAFIVRGTVGTAEWISNFDMGNDSVAKGFNLAARRAMNHFAQYKRDFPPVDPDACLVWLTGHSRGAAVANLVAGCYLSLPAEQVYCVAFATPNVATQTTRTPNILNFVLDSDVVTHVPFTAWGFDRYGLTVPYSKDSLQDIALTAPGDVKILVDFLSSVSQAEYYEMTLEVLHSDAIAARHDADLSDMLALNVSALISARMDHADKTTFTGLGLGVGVLFNTVFQQRLQLYLGELLPNESRATYDVVKNVITGAGSCHAMATYRQWIECLYHGLPTVTDTVPGGGVGSR